MHNIKYNKQRNNISYNGKFKAFWQCFTTSSWMFISFFTSLDALNDDSLSIYLDDVEESIGKPGIAEKIRRKYNWITKKTSFWWLVQEAGIKKWIEEYKTYPEDIEIAYSERKLNYDNIDSLLKIGPVIIQTDKMGGLPGGHIILIKGSGEGAKIVNDPFGNALTGYKSSDGESLYYPDEFLREYTGEKIRCIYAKRKVKK